MIMITLSTLMACIVTNMFFRGVMENRAPRWLRSVCINGIHIHILCLLNKLDCFNGELPCKQNLNHSENDGSPEQILRRIA